MPSTHLPSSDRKTFNSLRTSAEVKGVDVAPDITPGLDGQSLHTDDRTTHDGEKRTSYDIWADDVVNLSPREDGSRGQGETATSASGRGQNVERLGDEELNDLPF
jgi:hypothetical protein